TGGAHRTYPVAALHFGTRLDVDGRQMAEHADEALPVVDENGLAVEEIVACQYDSTAGGCPHRCSRGRSNVQARVRVAFLPVEEAPQTEGAAQAPGHGPVHLQIAGHAR